MLVPETPAFDGTHSRTWWETRDSGETSSAEGYWEQRTHPLREAIARAVEKLPGTSLLEVGVHAGPTMWAIAQRKHFDVLAGTELSPVILEFARQRLPEALGRPVELIQAAADKLPYADKSFDIVVTCGVLVCIGPEEIEASLAELLRVCRGYIVLSEPFSDRPEDATAAGRIDPYPNTSYWIRNYAGMLNGKVAVVHGRKLPPTARSGHMDSVVVLKVL